MVFEEPGRWDHFLSLVRSGMNGYEAVEHMGHNWKTLNAWFKRHPEAKEEFLEVKANAIEEPALRTLLDIHQNEEAKDSDRIQAAVKAVELTRREFKDEQEQRRAGNDDTVGTVIATIERLAELADKRLAIDVESVEATHTKESSDEDE